MVFKTIVCPTTMGCWLLFHSLSMRVTILESIVEILAIHSFMEQHFLQMISRLVLYLFRLSSVFFKYANGIVLSSQLTLH
jgi:hypothetical protein